MTSIKAVLAVVTVAAAGTLSAVGQTNQVDPKSFEAFKIITERNIFDPNRRPPRGPFVPRENPPPVDSFSLTGTMSYEKGMFAVFDGNRADYRVVLETGSKIAGYTVSEICHEFVKMSSGTNQVELKVGMQMRRSEDGQWTATEQVADYSSDSNSNFRRTGFQARNERNNNERNNRFGNSGGGRNNNFRNENFRNDNFRGDRSGQGGSDNSGQVGDGSTVPGEAGADLSDPVARLMMRRLQEMGGAESNQSNEDGDQRNRDRDDSDEDRDENRNNTDNPPPPANQDQNENR